MTLTELDSVIVRYRQGKLFRSQHLFQSQKNNAPPLLALALLATGVRHLKQAAL